MKAWLLLGAFRTLPFTGMVSRCNHRAICSAITNAGVLFVSKDGGTTGVLVDATSLGQSQKG